MRPPRCSPTTRQCRVTSDQPVDPMLPKLPMRLLPTFAPTMKCSPILLRTSTRSSRSIFLRCSHLSMVRTRPIAPAKSANSVPKQKPKVGRWKSRLPLSVHARTLRTKTSVALRPSPDSHIRTDSAPRRRCSSLPVQNRCAPPSNATDCSPTSNRSAPRCWQMLVVRASASGRVAMLKRAPKTSSSPRTTATSRSVTTGSHQHLPLSPLRKRS
ncbi:unannotated protein [freshwater metagenome]|uniref:Unannotated protein n=1 Tax=freshwater metagenome TaxID=449393 RepID=A0A6J5ZXX5_9ZZZZ